MELIVFYKDVTAGLYDEIQQYVHEFIFSSFIAGGKTECDWIIFQDLCAIKIVRNVWVENSKECPTATTTTTDVMWLMGS